MVGADSVHNCIQKPKSTYVLVSAGERQAKELLQKAKNWAEAFLCATPDEYKEAVAYTDNASEINFFNGSRIIALPSNPATVRGYSGNIVIDEFALIENDEELWRAIVPTITNEIAGRKGVSIISTPTSLTNRFAKIWNDPDSVFSKHKITIHDAVNQGLKADIEQLKKIVNDPQIFATEFMCEFCSDASSAFPQEWFEDISVEDVKEKGVRYLGYDVGRSKDLSVLIIVNVKDEIVTVEHVETYRNMPYRQQMECLERAIATFAPSAGHVDATGIGSMLAEEVQAKHPRIKPFLFNSSSKTSTYDRLRKTLQSRQLLIKKDFYEQTMSDMLGVKRMIGSTGKVSYSALHTTDGHSDITSALALAVEASHAMPACFSEPLSWLPKTTMGRIPRKF